MKPIFSFSPFSLRANLAGFFLATALAFAPLLRAAEQLYTCGMHPQIVRKEGGACPLCNMTLEPVRSNSAEAGAVITPPMSASPGEANVSGNQTPTAAATVHIDARTIQKMNLKTAVIGRGPVRREIRAVGLVAYDEEKLRDITTKYDGWIEKLHVNTTWVTIKTGDPLFDIYSPDLYKAQMSYLMSLRSEGANASSATKASLNRLQLYDVSADSLATLVKDGEAHPFFTYRAPVSGTVIEKMAIVGQMIKSGDRIYRIADLSSVWILAQIYENDLPLVQIGQEALVKLTYGPERTIPAQISLLLPQIDERTRTATARLAVANPQGTLRPGMFVDVRFTRQIADSALLVPDLAVLRSGERNTVFVALAGGAFQPREVQLGARSEGNFYQVLSGLDAGERVVTSGQFLLDSESQLREAIQKMLGSASEPTDAQSPGSHPTHAVLKSPDALKTVPPETCVSAGLETAQVDLGRASANVGR